MHKCANHVILPVPSQEALLMSHALEMELTIPMTDRMNGGSPVVHSPQYQTVPTAVIGAAQQRDRYLTQNEAKEMSAFFAAGGKRLAIAQTLSQHALKIVAVGANRIFVGGNPMNYLELPEDPVGLPGSDYYVAEDYLSAAQREEAKQGRDRSRPRSFSTTDSPLEWFKGVFTAGKPSIPSQFSAIDISWYGTARMKRSMRDLSWFLRYITYAIVAGDASIITVNTKGLRGVIPEDVTLATTVALREMQWKALTYFSDESPEAALVRRYFDILIDDYSIEKPPQQLRTGVSKHHQGLRLPQSYSPNAHPRWMMRPTLSDLEKDDVIRATYRHVFERDITRPYGASVAELVSSVKGGRWSIKEFVRQLGRSRLYRQLYYEPYTISRSIELAFRHFLGRGLSCMDEFQTYFDLVSTQGFGALVNMLVDSQEYADYFGEDTVPYLRGLGLEAQECRNWGPQLELFKYSAPVRKQSQFVNTFAGYQQPLPNQHPYGVGNDMLEIQFGAIFPKETRNPSAQPAHFHEDSRRILIETGAGTSNGGTSGRSNGSIHGSAHLGRAPGSLEYFVLHWDTCAVANGNGSHKQSLPTANPAANDSSLLHAGLTLSHHSPDAIIRATYRQVLGCEVFAGRRHQVAETQLKGGRITLREFVRQIAKSRPFRRMYWEELYVTKAIEVIHRRLLGRPTYGRRELNRYYDICGHQGFYALVDTLIDSEEYQSVFGETGVPYERYVTPRGYAARSPKGPIGYTKPRENPISAGEWMQQHPYPFSNRDTGPDSTTVLAVTERLSKPASTADAGPSGALTQEDAPAPSPQGSNSQETSVPYWQMASVSSTETASAHVSDGDADGGVADNNPASNSISTSASTPSTPSTPSVPTELPSTVQNSSY